MNLTQTRYLLDIYKRIVTGLPVDLDNVESERKKAVLEKDKLVVAGSDTSGIDEYISELENILYYDNHSDRN